MSLIINRNVPGRVETAPGGRSFKLNPNPKATMRPGDETPGSYAPLGATNPAKTTNTTTAGTTTGGGGSGSTGGGAGAGGPTTPGMTNTAAPNPDMQQALADYKARIEQQKAREGQTDPLLQEQVENLRARMSADQTARATDRAGSNIRDFAAGQRSQADSASARMGRPQGFRDAAIDEAAGRNQARAAADIQLGQMARLDNLTLGGTGIMGAQAQERLAREAGVTGLIGGQMNAAGAGAGLALEQQRLGLQSYSTTANLELERQRMQQQQRQQEQEMLMRLISSGGY